MTYTWKLGLVPCGLMCTVAHADVVHFTNPAPGQPGHFDWHWEAGFPWQSWLDVTRSAADQLNVPSGDAVAQFGFRDSVSASNYAEGGAAVAIEVNEFGDQFTQAVFPGTSLPALTFRATSLHVYMDFENPVGEPSLFTEGHRAYIGVLTASALFGWIEVERTGMSLTAYSWAFESEPGVPLFAGQVPAPGAVALLGAGLVGVSMRRRRR